MCGIMGVIGNKGTSIPPSDIAHALGAIRHRGPDDEGYLFYEAHPETIKESRGADTAPDLHRLPHIDQLQGDFDIAFAHRRLSVLDVSSAGHQPMSFANERYWLVFNGEIYNYVELREAL